MWFHLDSTVAIKVRIWAVTTLDVDLHAALDKKTKCHNLVHGFYNPQVKKKFLTVQFPIKQAFSHWNWELFVQPTAL